MGKCLPFLHIGKHSQECRFHEVITTLLTGMWKDTLSSSSELNEVKMQYETNTMKVQSKFIKHETWKDFSKRAWINKTLVTGGKKTCFYMSDMSNWVTNTHTHRFFFHIDTSVCVCVCVGVCLTHGLSLSACHILECCDGLAQNVISTIGQAFELQFKQYLHSPPKAIHTTER